jgi:hypothetical protein
MQKYQMSVYELDPVRDPRWQDLLQRDRRASVFHSPEWLLALERTYGYKPVVFTTFVPGKDLQNGIVFCEVRSWLTGRRLVSLPFSDHCEPLTSADHSFEITRFLQNQLKKRHWKYIEIRALTSDWEPQFGYESEKFCFHKLNLMPSVEQLFSSFHNGSVRRRVQRAMRENLVIESGRGPELIKEFYRLFVLTRRRHGLPPCPIGWFHNLAECLGDVLQIWIASKGTQPIAAILTLTYKNCMVYKYGGSDAQFNNLAGTPLLFWTAIQEAKGSGMQEFDFGRSDIDNQGLITFKDHFATTKSALIYRRVVGGKSRNSEARHEFGLTKRLFAAMPDLLRIQAGKLLYKHVA